MSLGDRIMQQSSIARRTLAVVLLFVALTLAWQVIIPPIHAIFTSQDRWLAHASSTLAIARARAAEAPTLRRRLKALADAPIWLQLYPHGDPANENAAVREDVTRYAALAGVTARSIAPLPTRKQLSLSKPGVTISGIMTIGQLTNFLTQLRESHPYLRVDALRVVAPQIQSSTGNERLFVQMQIFGYARPMTDGSK